MQKQNSFSSNIFHEFKLMFLLFRFGIKDTNSDLSKIFADLMITAMRFGVVVWLYSYLFSFKGGEKIMGVSLQTVAWSMFFYFIFMFINPRTLSNEIQKDIQSGRIEVLLGKPMNYVYYKLGEYLGGRFLTFIVSTIVSSILVISFLGIPNQIQNNLFFFFTTFSLTFLFGFILSFQIFTILGLCAFWIQDISPIRWIIDKTVMILGGAYFPVAFFPEILKKVSLYSPIGASQFITYTAYENWSQIYLKMFLLQLFWIIILGVILFSIQKKAFKKLSVNGG
jgi:ABC-2 type transport system permease protein